MIPHLNVFYFLYKNSIIFFCVKFLFPCIPCIATNVGGTSEIVVNGINGYLIDDEDDEYIAGKVDSIATMNAEGYRQLRDAARNTK